MSKEKKKRTNKLILKVDMTGFGTTPVLLGSLTGKTVRCAPSTPPVVASLIFPAILMILIEKTLRKNHRLGKNPRKCTTVLLLSCKFNNAYASGIVNLTVSQLRLKQILSLPLKTPTSRLLGQFDYYCLAYKKAYSSVPQLQHESSGP
jgi:hypothetical protein